MATPLQETASSAQANPVTKHHVYIQLIQVTAYFMILAADKYATHEHAPRYSRSDDPGALLSSC